MALKIISLLMLGSFASAFIPPTSAMAHAAPAPRTTEITAFSGSRSSSPKKTVGRKSTPAKPVPESKVAAGLSLIGSVLGVAVNASPLGSDRLKGRDNLLTKSKRDKTEQPGMNIGNYQQWGPVGAAKEAFDLLTGLVKSE